MPPARKEITGPNQRWCWDISYLHTYERSVFLYLYLLLDEYSRKAIHWLISWHQRAEDAQSFSKVGCSPRTSWIVPKISGRRLSMTEAGK